MSTIILAKRLRTAQTPWEAKLWYRLRGNRLLNLKFKRQVPIGKYIVDFCCNERKLVIELDGSQHIDTEHRIRDMERDKFLSQNGYSVLRFYNNEIDTNLEGILEKIRIFVSK